MKTARHAQSLVSPVQLRILLLSPVSMLLVLAHLHASIHLLLQRCLVVRRTDAYIM